MQTALEQLQDQVRRVHEARLLEASLGDAVQEKRQAFEESIAAEREAAQRASAEVESAEAALRALTLAYFAQTGEKRPVAGVQVKEITKLVYDELEAFAWAKGANLAVKPEALDVKAFEKIAKATALPFVRTAVEHRAEIASALPVEVAP